MTPPPARYATVATPPGPFTVVVTDDPDGGDVVLASGWTDDVAELLPVVHRALRPTWVERADGLPVLDTVEAFFAGDVDRHRRRARCASAPGPSSRTPGTSCAPCPPASPDTYASFAARCGRPTAVRAAANACARNAAALFVPCHRVLGSGGGLGGFRWGTPVKRRLLDHEARYAPVAAA